MTPRSLRRESGRQGAGRAGDSFQVAALARAVRRGELLGDSTWIARKANSLVTSAALLQARPNGGGQSRAGLGRYALSRRDWATCRWSCNPSCCECCKSASFRASADLNAADAGAVIAANHQDLESALAEKSSRGPLLRLRVIPIDSAAVARAARGYRGADRLLYRQGVREMGATSRYISAEARAKLQELTGP